MADTGMRRVGVELHEPVPDAFDGRAVCELRVAVGRVEVEHGGRMVSNVYVKSALGVFGVPRTEIQFRPE